MSELRTLIDKIENNRKRQEIIRFGSAFGAGLCALVFLLMLMPKPAPQDTTVVENTLGSSAFEGIAVEARAAVVYDLTTGEVLYEKNAQAQLPLASLTKLLTVYAGVTSLGSGSVITVSDEALRTEGDSGFSVGESFAFSEIAEAALVPSSNDAAAAIAENAEDRRALPAPSLLANAAASAGLTATYALNGTGLDENGVISGGYGSAQDVAILAGALLERARPIVDATTQPTITISSLSGNTYTFKNTNPTVTTVPGLRLSKTGFTDLAGGNLAVVFDASVNHPIAVVVLGSSVNGRFSDADALIKATLSSFVSMNP